MVLVVIYWFGYCHSFMLALLYILHAVARVIFQKNYTSKKFSGFSLHKEHEWFHVAFTVFLSLACMTASASSPRASLPCVLYSSHTRLFVTISSVFLSYKILSLFQNQSECCLCNAQASAGGHHGSLCTPRASRCYLVWSTKKCPQWGPCPNPQNLWLWYLIRGTLQMWLRILKWEKYTGLSRWAQCNHKRPYKRELGGQEERSCWLAGFWEGQGAEECRWPLGDGKGQERGSPPECPEGVQLVEPWY